MRIPQGELFKCQGLEQAKLAASIWTQPMPFYVMSSKQHPDNSRARNLALFAWVALAAWTRCAWTRTRTVLADRGFLGFSCRHDRPGSENRDEMR